MPAAPGRSVELRVQRKLTSRFVNSDPVEITLYYQQATSGEDLGVTPGTSVQRAPQTFHMSATVSAPQRTGLAGTAVTPEYQLVGEWDRVVQRGDWFYLNGQRHDVVYVYPQGEMPYEVRAEVVLRA